MKTILGVIGAVAAIAMATPAAAGFVEYQYSGSVLAVFGPEPTGVVAGDPVHVRLRFDPANLVDVTDLAALETGLPYTDLKAASLQAPGAFIKVSAGPNEFTQADQLNFFGDAFGFGSPYVLFNNGAFFGIDFFALNSGQAGFATAGAFPELFDFVGGGFEPDGGPSYAGYFDYSSVRSAAVPEPASWTLMIAGFGLAGVALRRRRIGGIVRGRAIALATTAVLAAATSPALAAPPAPAPTVTVAYADLDLSSPVDAAVMLQRIRKAAATACQRSNMMIGTDIETVERYEACRRVSTVTAVARLDARQVSAAFSEDRRGGDFTRAVPTHQGK
ncbi:MAG: UrcA family protein [Phenylobacterium sp.]